MRRLAVLCVIAWAGCSGVLSQGEADEDSAPGGEGGLGDEGGAGVGGASFPSEGGRGAGENHAGAPGQDASVGVAGTAGMPTARDGGVADAEPTMVADEPPQGWVPAIVGVGYAGIRALSKDLGKTWPIHPALAAGPGNDDGDLLRGVTYGKGLWLAGGWKHLISTDGVNWKPSPLPKGCGLMESVAYGNGMFMAACGDGDTFISIDGRTWRNGKQGIGTGRHMSVVFGLSAGLGKFAVSGDTGASFASTDGSTWTALQGINRVRYCRGDFHSSTSCPGFEGHGVWLRTGDRSTVERSPDGKTWSTVATFPSFIGWYAFGYAPP